MNPDIFSDSATSAPSRRLFPFTPAEDAAIKRAMISAARFMENYGKGREPYTIDVSHYANSQHKTEWNRKTGE